MEANVGFLAHSANGAGRGHPLREHLSQVSRLAGELLQGSPQADAIGLAGLLHDLGK